MNESKSTADAVELSRRVSGKIVTVGYGTVQNFKVRWTDGGSAKGDIDALLRAFPISLGDTSLSYATMSGCCYGFDLDGYNYTICGNIQDGGSFQLNVTRQRKKTSQPVTQTRATAERVLAESCKLFSWFRERGAEFDISTAAKERLRA